jgi:hypothetical protein
MQPETPVRKLRRDCDGRRRGKETGYGWLKISLMREMYAWILSRLGKA